MMQPAAGAKRISRFQMKDELLTISDSTCCSKFLCQVIYGTKVISVIVLKSVFYLLQLQRQLYLKQTHVRDRLIFQIPRFKYTVSYPCFPICSCFNLLLIQK